MVNGVDVTIRQGEVLAIIGANGAGKSTMLGFAAWPAAAGSGTDQLLDRRSLSPYRPAAAVDSILSRF
ncbi:hypothetical protein DOE73_22070 [Paenibacillus dendritiformis]|nr:hypothetical protein DOE73_22070 [Paenibacillus dendritiformis]